MRSRSRPSSPAKSSPFPNATAGERGFQAGRPAAVDATDLVVSASEGAFERLSRLAALLLDAPLAFVTVVDTTRSWHRTCVGLGPHADRFAFVEESFCRYVVEGDVPLVLDDARADPRTRENRTIVGIGIVAWAGFPIHGPDGDVIGTFCVVDTVPRRWSARDVQVIETLADAASGEIALRAALAAEAQAHAEAEERVAEAAELARQVADLAERSDVLARTLRQSLLPPLLPEVPDLEIAARYQPARGEEVVGDFYDVFRAARSSWCVVMGDVCGKGPDAATVTALAHYTLRAAAARSVSPARVLGLLNTVLLHQRPGDERFVTVALASVRILRGRVLVTLSRPGTRLLCCDTATGPLRKPASRGWRLVCSTSHPCSTRRSFSRPATALSSTPTVSPKPVGAPRSSVSTGSASSSPRSPVGAPPIWLPPSRLIE